MTFNGLLINGRKGWWRGIEQRKTNEASQKAADMRFPSYNLVGPQNRNLSEQKIGSKPHCQERNQTAVTQHRPQWRRWHPIGMWITTPQGANRSPLLENEPDGRRHGARNRSRRTDYRRAIAEMDRKMGSSTGRCRHQKENKKPRRTESARHRSTKGHKYDPVEKEMIEIDMDESVGHERPNGRPPANPPRVRGKPTQVITRRDEGEDDQHFSGLFVVQAIGDERMDEADRRQDREDDAWHIENSLAR